MQSELVWLSTSLFCSKRNWHSLLNDGVHGFLQTDFSRNYLSSFLFELNFLGGENIRFSMLTNDDSAPALLTFANDYFNTFFISFIERDEKKLSSISKMFQPFRDNSIQYGLYPPLRIEMADLEKFDIPIQVSCALLIVFKGEEVTDETILAFAFYLLMGSIRTLLSTHAILFEAILDCYSLNECSHDSDDTIFIESKLSENREMVIEMVDEIFNHTSAVQPKWIIDWISFCRQQLQKIKYQSLPLEKAIDFHNKVSFYVHKQLCINKRGGTLLSCFLNQGLKIISENNYTDPIQEFL